MFSCITERFEMFFCTISDLSEEDIFENIENDYDGSSDSESGMGIFNLIFKL